MKSSHFGATEVEEVSDDDSECQLEQGDGDAELDGDHRGNDDYGGEDCSELDWLHGSTSSSFRLHSVEAISPAGRLWSEPHRSSAS
jgi:hypothetical protein